MKLKLPRIPKLTFSPVALFFLTVLLAFFYIFIEWLFIATKPSFLQQATFPNQLLVLAASGGLLVLVSLVLILPFVISNTVSGTSRVTAVLRWLALAVPALLLSVTVLMLVDNFTYTVFNYGIVSTKGIMRVVYLLLFLLLAARLYAKLIGAANFISEITEKRSRAKTRTAALLLLTAALLCVGIPAAAYISANGKSAGQPGTSAAHLPNVLLITADSLNADRMSLYGYPQDTTPFLEELASSSLVAENAFSNAQGTIGSITSILTGRAPIATRMLTSLDLLRGEDTGKHLPGLLRRYGYYSVQLSYSFYADAHRLNFVDGFDEANGAKLSSNPVFAALTSIFPSNISYFQAEIINRVADRLGHVLFIHDMTNPYLQVTQSPEKFNDLQKMEYALELFKTVKQPLFIHIHWMGTHGPTYHIANQVFSAGKSQDGQAYYDNDFYIDSILEFDQALRTLYAGLEELNQVDNTLMIVSADHSQRWNVLRLPLVMHFPESDHTGVIRENVQYLDIAPTILSALRIPQPTWMAGESLLSGEVSDEPIITVEIPSMIPDPKTGKKHMPDVKPPFYQFGKVSVVQCDQWFKLEITGMKWTNGIVPNYREKCTLPRLTEKAALQAIIQYFKAYGYDTSSLE